MRQLVKLLKTYISLVEEQEAEVEGIEPMEEDFNITMDDLKEMAV